MPISFRPFLLNTNAVSSSATPATYERLLASVNYNLGNSYISYAVLKGLHGTDNRIDDSSAINNIWLDPLESQAERINDEFSHVLLFLQDQIRADNNFDRWDYVNNFIDKIRIPIIVFSLGANSLSGWDVDLHNKLPSRLIRFLIILSHKTAVLGVRGEFTADVLTKLEIKNHEIIGCPSYFECGPSRQVRKRDLGPDAKILATGLFANSQSARLYYVLQSESVLLKAFFSGSTELTAAEVDLLDDNYPGYRECVSDAMRDRRVFAFFDPRKWKTLVAQDFAFSAGTRLHGAIVSINAGIPALVTNGDARAKEVTDYFRIPLLPGICGLDFELQELYDGLDIDRMNERYDDVFANYCDWLRLNGLTYGGTVT